MSNFVSSLKKKIKQAEANDLGWSFERPKELVITENDTIGSLLHTFNLHFQWWSTRWSRMDEMHQNALINLFGAHPQILQHVWKILDKNLDENNVLRHEKWRFEDLEFTLFEKLGLMNDDVEVEVYRKLEKPLEEEKEKNV
jgi:hypothetical protein